MSTRLVLVLATLVSASCAGGGGPSAQPTPSPTVASTFTVTEAPETPGPTADPILVGSFCDPFASEVLPAWPPADAAAAGDLDAWFRARRESGNLAALTDDMTAVLAYLAAARSSSDAVSPTTTAAEAFAHIEAFAAENC